MLIVNARLITWEEPNRILDDYGLFVENNVIKEMGPTAEILRQHPDPSPVDARGQFVLPGNICAHTHFYGAFARGMAIPGDAPRDFPEILRKLWWPLDKALTPEDIRSSALVCLVDAVRHGTTLLVDHHASPNAIDGSLDVIAEAVEESGLRAVLCYEVTDRDGPEKARAGIRENVRFIDKLNSEKQNHPLLSAAFGLHASLTLSAQTLDAARNAAPDGTGFHIHAAEGDADQLDSLAKYGKRVVNRLQDHGILGPKSILAHCVRVDEREIEVLAEAKNWVTHQPRSNMNNAVGVAPIEQMLKAGVRIGLGNDGFSNAMWEEWKTAYLVHKVWNRDPRRMPASEVAQMAVYNNAALAESFFTDLHLGKIAPGSAADLIFVDYHPFTPLTVDNLPWQIIFGFQESMVTTTIVGGKLLMRDRQLLTLDEEAISRKALELSTSVWKRYGNNLK
ncbi:MAG TPA: putative aminohydrolase SsnA [Anaerolineales bacterium]|nr:putative aminohydrolase SsnA [Anaerolineales bacterium]